MDEFDRLESCRFCGFAIPLSKDHGEMFVFAVRQHQKTGDRKTNAGTLDWYPWFE